VEISFRKKETVRILVSNGNCERVVYGSVKNIGRLVGGCANNIVKRERGADLLRKTSYNKCSMPCVGKTVSGPTI